MRIRTPITVLCGGRTQAVVAGTVRQLPDRDFGAVNAPHHGDLNPPNRVLHPVDLQWELRRQLHMWQCDPGTSG